MDKANDTLRERVIRVVVAALESSSRVLAGWEGGSAAFDRIDAYSDIDLNFLLGDGSPEDPLFGAVETALETVSPVEFSHPEPPGRYFKLADGGDFLLVDVCFYQTTELSEHLDAARHGETRALFDKGQWLQRNATSADSQVKRRTERLMQLDAWFATSQLFPRKAVLRGKEVDALAAFWGYTLKPLVELLRMRHCPARWDFGMRDLDRDLPDSTYRRLRQLMYCAGPDELPAKLEEAKAWADELLSELKRADSVDS
ncbi:MAG: hypothetical protein AAF488_01550 [Planctomycetota bacterium]